MSFISDIFGGGGDKAPTVQYQPRGFSAGGIRASPTGDITETPQRIGLVQGVQNAYGGAASELGKLRETVAPGFNSLLKARLADLENNATSAIGNLRQNLASRRILGSSFGNDTLSNLAATFAQQRDKEIADNFLQSLDANQKLLAQQYQASVNQYQSGLNDLNFQADIGAKLSQQGNDILAQNARVNADLQSKYDIASQQGTGRLIGTALALGAAPFTGGASLAAIPAITRA